MNRNKDFLLTIVLAIKVIMYVQKETPVSESLFNKVCFWSWSWSLYLVKLQASIGDVKLN